jgi:hypothetical protein
MKFGGKPTKTSSDSKRHFTVVMGGKEHGLYVSSTPSSAARKAVTKLCTANKSKKVQFEIREITQGSKKKTYGPYKGYIEKLKEPIELKGRVIRYKPVAKLNRKKIVQKGGEEFKYSRHWNDKIYRAIHKKLVDGENFLTEQELDDLGFNNPITDRFFKKATTYLWILKPEGFQDFDEKSSGPEGPKYYYGILRIRPRALFKIQSIYIAFRVNISKKKLERPKIESQHYWGEGRYFIPNTYYYSETIIELTFLAKGVSKEAFRQHLLKKNSVAPIHSNRYRSIAELIELIQTHNTIRYDEEFRDLQVYLTENISQLKNSFANAPPHRVSQFTNNLASAPPPNRNNFASAPFLNINNVANAPPPNRNNVASAPFLNINNVANAPPFNINLENVPRELINNITFVFTGPYHEIENISDAEIIKLLKNIDCEIEISRKTEKSTETRNVMVPNVMNGRYRYVKQEFIVDRSVEVIVKMTPKTFSNNHSKYLDEFFSELKYRVITLFTHFFKKKTRPSKNIKIFIRTYIDESKYQDEDIRQLIKDKLVEIRER